MKFKELTKQLNEKTNYELYHTTYSAAIQSALDYAKANGYEVDEDDVWDQISTGPRKPSNGKTNRASIALKKGGKETRKNLSIQVYGMGSKYELNTYIA